MRQESSFRCANCRATASEDPLGSKHRNHCPICLWSKHVDLNTPGDRRSLCQARMKPIALAFKDYEINPFTGRGSGELMIIHKCTNCNRISPNRIAGDDSEDQILSILEDSLCLDTWFISKIHNIGINIIKPGNKKDVLISLFGVNYKRSLRAYALKKYIGK